MHMNRNRKRRIRTETKKEKDQKLKKTENKINGEKWRIRREWEQTQRKKWNEDKKWKVEIRRTGTEKEKKGNSIKFFYMKIRKHPVIIVCTVGNAFVEYDTQYAVLMRINDNW